MFDIPHVRIYQPCKSAMQSGTALPKRWELVFDRTTPLGTDPLMGWTSSTDTLDEVILFFDTLEEAIEFSQKKGFNYRVVLPSSSQKLRPKSYGDNFRFDRVRI